MTLDASETFAFAFARELGFLPEKVGPNNYLARASVDATLSVSAPTVGQFVRELASASKRMKRGDKR